MNYLFHFHSGILRKLNVVIAMDGSKAVDAETFKKVKDFAIGAMDAYEISRNRTHVSIVTFGNMSSINLDLSNSVSKSMVKHAISTARRPGGSRDIGNAAAFIQRMVFDRLHRNDAGNVLVFIIAGLKQEMSNAIEFKKTLEELKRNKVKVVMVVVGDMTKSEELSSAMKNEQFVKIPLVNSIKEALGPIVDASGKAAGKCLLIFQHSKICVC